MLRWPRDFDNEPDNSDNLMRSAGPEDRNSLGVHPLRARVGPHDTELTRRVRGTIRPERLHSGLVKSAPILRMHALQKQTEFSGHIALNTENMPQLVRPILFAGVKINVEESDFFCPPEFHFHLFPSLVVGLAREEICLRFAGTDVLCVTGDICWPKSVTPECEHFVRAGVETSFASQFAQGPEINATVSADRSLAWAQRRMTLLFKSFAPTFSRHDLMPLRMRF